VMAGAPSIMQAMLDEVGPKLKTGIRMLSETVRADVRESDIATQLGEIAKANPGVAIGSHPFFDPQHGQYLRRAARPRRTKAPARQARGGGHVAAGAGSPIEQRLRAAGSLDAYPIPEYSLFHPRDAGDAVLCARPGLRLRASQGVESTSGFRVPRKRMDVRRQA
jgi:hypothetical protein